MKEFPVLPLPLRRSFAITLPASSVSLVESGLLRWMVEVKRKFLNSEINQHISPRLDFDTTITWMERPTPGAW